MSKENLISDDQLENVSGGIRNNNTSIPSGCHKKVSVSCKLIGCGCYTASVIVDEVGKHHLKFVCPTYGTCILPAQEDDH